jgi:hypothetical protein
MHPRSSTLITASCALCVRAHTYVPVVCLTAVQERRFQDCCDANAQHRGKGQGQGDCHHLVHLALLDERTRLPSRVPCPLMMRAARLHALVLAPLDHRTRLPSHVPCPLMMHAPRLAHTCASSLSGPACPLACCAHSRPLVIPANPRCQRLTTPCFMRKRVARTSYTVHRTCHMHA